MNLSSLLLPTFENMLTALPTWLDRGAEALGADALPGLRLAPDMFALDEQVMTVARQVHWPLALLTGGEQPALDKQATVAGMKEQLADALVAARAADAAALDAAEGLEHEVALPNGMSFTMRGDDYARDWVVPQFYFHVMAVYAILRHHGVPLGKRDFAGHMIRHLRPT